MRFTPYIIPFVISVVILAALMIYAWKYRYRNVAKYFSLTMFMTLIWTIGFIFEILNTSLAGKLFWADIQFLGIAFLPVMWLLMVINYMGRKVSSLWVRLLLYSPPILTNIMIWTNQWHHLFRINPSLDISHASFSILVNDYGPWFYAVHSIHGNLLFLISFYFLIRLIISTRDMYRKQALILFGASLVPLIIDLLYIFGFSPINNFNMTSVFFSLSGIAIGWSLIQHRFLDLIPVARIAIVDSLEDAWFVLDDTNRIIDLNDYAVTLFGLPRKNLIGMPLIDALGPKVEHYKGIIDQVRLQKEIKTTKGIDYELRIVPLRLAKGDVSGRLVLMRNISERKKVEEDREQLIVELKEALERVRTLSGLLPICSHCKKVRDDDGYWHSVEKYITSHSEAVFSHGICPDCMVELYPEYSKKKNTPVKDKTDE